jgi:hypothetical protein
VNRRRDELAHLAPVAIDPGELLLGYGQGALGADGVAPDFAPISRGGEPPVSATWLRAGRDELLLARCVATSCGEATGVAEHARAGTTEVPDDQHQPMGPQPELTDGVVSLTAFREEHVPATVAWDHDPEMARWFDFPALPPEREHIEHVHGVIAVWHAEYQAGTKTA